MHDVLVAEIILDETGVIAAIGEIIARGMAQHVRMDMEAQLGAQTTLLDEIIHGLPCHGAAFTEEEIGGAGILTLVALT